MFIYQPPEPERKVKATEGRGPSRRLEETVEHVSRGWVPVNPQVLKQVQEKLASNAYRGSPGELLEDLKTDPGLFVHAVKNLSSVVTDAQGGIDPLSELAKLEEEKLKKIFSVNERQVSMHRFRDMRKVQGLRYQHSVISSRTAEVMAEKVQVPPNMAYASVALRQLGHYLVSWNYPDIYGRALTAQRRKGGNLELELAKYLGITPLQIAAKFSASWNLHPDLKLAVSPPRQMPGRLEGKEAPLVPEEGGRPRMTLQKLCEVSELFAEANDPENYPQAKEKWQTVQAVLQQHIGADVLQKAYEAVIASLALTDRYVPRLLDPPFFKRSQLKSTMTPRACSLFERNGFVKRCPPAIAEALVKVYERIEEADKVSVEALRLLADDVIPQAGFVRGCLYVLDTSALTLRPVLRIGSLALSQYQPVAIYENSPVAEALYTSVPLKQEGKSAAGGLAMQICGSLGSYKRPGVLYLEFADSEIELAGYNPFACFQAIRQALLDCLGDSF